MKKIVIYLHYIFCYNRFKEKKHSFLIATKKPLFARSFFGQDFFEYERSPLLWNKK